MSSLVKFVPVQSFVHNDFWHKYAQVKIDIDRLNDGARPLAGWLEYGEKQLLLEVECDSLNTEAPLSKRSASVVPCRGTLLNKNTIEAFKSCNKLELLRYAAVEFYERLFAEELATSADIVHYLMLSFSDLKKYAFYYWFAFPVPASFLFEHCRPEEPVDGALPADAVATLNRCCTEFFLQRTPSEPFFVYRSCNSGQILTLTECISHRQRDDNFADSDLGSVYFCFMDIKCPDPTAPHWLFRQFLVYLALACPQLHGKEINCVSIRQPGKLNGGSSRLYTADVLYRVRMPTVATDETDLQQANWVGWEMNYDGKYIPRYVNLGSTMNPERLAEGSINLNLKLMKWRLVPDLNLDVIQQTKCLLLGAGTLGCGVARSLMAWGVNHLTFIDSGKVSFSNPVRQTLYRYEDALDGGKDKASIAAARLKEINPTVTSSGHCIKIPMPGHPVSALTMSEVMASLEVVKREIQQHDVIFLLTDSRESRWLPTLLAMHYGKIVINAALGFDSFLVMRHGVRTTTPPPMCDNVPGFRAIGGSELGCYFCNDIVAPANSMKDRTLDQQCTVTRPAVSSIASGLAVELMVALLQHEHRSGAPAYYKLARQGASRTDECHQEEPEGILGRIPHSIRGNISSLDFMVTATEHYPECIACSKVMVQKFVEDGDDFIIEVLNNQKVLEDTVGLSKLLYVEDEGILEIDTDSSD